MVCLSTLSTPTYLLFRELLIVTQDTIGQGKDLFSQYFTLIALQILGILLTHNRILREMVLEICVDDSLGREISN